MKKSVTFKRSRVEKTMNRYSVKNILKAVAVLVFILVAGCTVGPDFKKPVVETPENYRSDNMPVEPEVNLEWWKLFNDPVLYAFVTMALENNRDLQLAAARVEEARASVGFTRADQFPHLNIQGGAGTGNFGGSSRSDERGTNYFISPMVNWEIDFWGKFSRATEAARAQFMASEYALRTVQISLISEVVGVYYLLLDYHQRLEISKSTLKSRKKSLDIIQKRFDRGIIPELDVNQAQIQKEIAASAIPLYERSAARTENAMSILLGKLPGSIKIGKGLTSQSVPPVIPVDLPSNLLERRPDVNQAMNILKAQTANIGVAEAYRLPSITLTGLFGLASTQLSSLTSSGGIWSVQGGLLGPIFEFYKNIRRVEIEEAKTKQALAFYENTALIAFREVEDALVDISTYKNQIAAVSNKVKAAKNANRLSKLRYDKGVSSYLEVLETERALFSAELELSELRQQYLNSYVGLYKALGGGWITKEEKEKAGTVSEMAPRKERSDLKKLWMP
jgi:multidrug efflux system outer membrane protein